MFEEISLSYLQDDIESTNQVNVYCIQQVTNYNITSGCNCTTHENQNVTAITMLRHFQFWYGSTIGKDSI
jgi:hypothetical protein